MKYTACAKKSWRYQLQSKNNLTASYNICNLTSTFFYSRRCHLLNLLSFVSFLSPSGDLGIGLVWDNHPTPPHQTTTHFLVRLLKSSSNWTKSSMMGHQLFLGWYQMILDVFRCSHVFWCFPTVFHCFLTMFSDCWNPFQADLNYLWWVLSCSQDDIRWF